MTPFALLLYTTTPLSLCFHFFPSLLSRENRISTRRTNFYRATRVKRVKTLFPRILRFFEYFSSVVNRFKYPLINFQRFLFVRNQSIQSHSIVTPCIFFQVSKVSRVFTFYTTFDVISPLYFHNSKFLLVGIFFYPTTDPSKTRYFQALLSLD